MLRKLNQGVTKIVVIMNTCVKLANDGLQLPEEILIYPAAG